MALIVCPECGKEYSDKALCCPCCACPTEKKEDVLVKDTVEGNIYQETDESLVTGIETKRKRRGRVPIFILGVLGSIAIVTVLSILVINKFFAKGGNRNTKKADAKYGSIYAEAIQFQSEGRYMEAKELYDSTPGYEESDTRAVFCNAISCCERGNYSTAYELLRQIPEYDEAKKLLVQVYYESLFFEGLNDYRENLKNPDSLQLNSVQSYYSKISSITVKKEEPVFVARVSAQNGLGGYSQSIILILKTDDLDSYKYMGSCKNLDSSSYDDELEYVIAEGIKEIKDKCVEMQDVMDFKRMTKIIEEDNYLSIRRIDGLQFDDILEGMLLLESKSE